jgi:hypothetical protein
VQLGFGEEPPAARAAPAALERHTHFQADAEGDRFRAAVALPGGRLLVAAPGDDSNTNTDASLMSAETEVSRWAATRSGRSSSSRGTLRVMFWLPPQGAGRPGADANGPHSGRERIACWPRA